MGSAIRLGVAFFLVALTTGASSTAHDDARAVVSIFQRVCLNGTGTFSAGTVEQVNSRKGPENIMSVLTVFNVKTVYKLNNIPDSYLITYSGPKDPVRQAEKGCIVATKLVSPYYFWSSITGRKLDNSRYQAADRYQLYKPSQGYSLLIYATPMGYVAANVSIMTDEQRKNAGEDRESFVPHYEK